MKISIVGAGNMGGAIACGLLSSGRFIHKDITVIDHKGNNVSRLKEISPEINIVVGIYDSLAEADVVILAVKPWLIEDLIMEHISLLENTNQVLVSVAANITLAQLGGWTNLRKPVYRVMPNTAIALRESMTFVSSLNAKKQHNELISEIFSELGKVEYISEHLFSAATSLGSCGIAFALRYVRAAMEGGIEMGLYPNQSRDIVIQTLRGAIDLLEANGSHPEVEIDKVTTAGGLTIKGLNEMEHSGFTSAVIKALKASNVK